MAMKTQKRRSRKSYVSTAAKVQLWVAKVQLWVAKVRLWVAKVRLRVAKVRLWVAKVQLWVAKIAKLQKLNFGHMQSVV